MASIFYNVYQSPADVFKEALHFTDQFENDKICRFQRGDKEYHTRAYGCIDVELSLLNSSTAKNFWGSWEEILDTFNKCIYKNHTRIIDEVIDNLKTIDFFENKWRYTNRLEEGDNINIDLYLNNSDKYWSGVRRAQKIKQTLKIYINFGGNCIRDESELAVSGAIGSTLAELLEAQGVSTEIWGCNYTAAADINLNDYVTIVKLKKQNEYADIGLINFMLGNNHVYRNCFFRIFLSQIYRKFLDARVGLGTNTECNISNLGLLKSEQQNVIIVPPIYSIEEAKTWLINTLTTLTQQNNI